MFERLKADSFVFVGGYRFHQLYGWLDLEKEEQSSSSIIRIV